MKHHDLVELIQSLTKTEKRYLSTQWLQSPKQAQLKILYQAILTDPTISNETLEKTMTTAGYNSPLYALKLMLFNKILDALAHFYKSQGISNTLRHTLDHIHVLYRKKSYRELSRRIQHGKQMAQRYDLFPILLELLHWERLSLINQFGGSAATEKLNILIQEESEITENLQRIISAKQQLNGILEKKKPDSSKLNIDINSAKSLQELTHLIYAQSSAYFFAQQPDKANIILGKLIEAFEEHPHRITDSPSTYLTTLNNVTGYYMRTQDLKKAERFMNKIKKAPEIYHLSTQDYTLRQHLQTLNLEMELYRLKQDWESCLTVKETILNAMSHHDNFPADYKQLFAFQLMYLHFILGHAQLFFHWDTIITSNETPDLLSAAAIFLKAIYHHQKHHHDILQSLLTSFKKTSPSPLHYDCFRDFFKQTNLTYTAFKTTFSRLGERDFFDFNCYVQAECLFGNAPLSGGRLPKLGRVIRTQPID